MNGSLASIILMGLGNGTFAGSPSLVITRGYGIGAAPVFPAGSKHFQVIDRSTHFDVIDRATSFEVEE